MCSGPALLDIHAWRADGSVVRRPDDRLDPVLVGVDVGSTTVKLVLLESRTLATVHSAYERHRAAQAETVLRLLGHAHVRFPDRPFRMALCGSGAQTIAGVLGAFFTQEVVANGIAVADLHPRTRTAIEIGGQDAKILFLGPPRGHDSAGAADRPIVLDMRMNGVCAGGTGAFIDQVAELLGVCSEELAGLAAEGRSLHEVSGRCGVFARTDIQPLLNQGVARADIALSALHAVAKQVIGGLAQGAELRAPVLLEGGPLCFNPVLARAFQERLGLEAEEITRPENGAVLVAHGAALSTIRLHGDQPCEYGPERLSRLRSYVSGMRSTPGAGSSRSFFTSPTELRAYRERRALPAVPLPAMQAQAGRPASGRSGAAKAEGAEATRVTEVFLGIDAGSTTSKFVFLDRSGELVDRFYSNNNGDPIGTVQRGLAEMMERYEGSGRTLKILGAGSTGYGEALLFSAFRLDYRAVETIAHTRAARHYCPQVSFILDIGGQDMKAIFVRDGIPVNFVLNEACSAGCGSFLENCAATMGVPVERIADLAFAAGNPSELGARCTVFMNSSIVTEQKNGRTVEDIMAGLCRAVIENAITKVLRVSNPGVFGRHIVVQGGTFRNDAVLRAFEERLDVQVLRPPYPGEMGAIGVGLLTIEHMARTGGESGFRLPEALDLKPRYRPASVCSYCPNSCRRSVIEFSATARHVAGNRCAKGEVLEEDGPVVVRERLRAAQQMLRAVPNLVEYRQKALLRDRVERGGAGAGLREIRVGFPRTLDFWDSLPFWKALFDALGFETVVSKASSPATFERGMASVSSDTICLPAKLVHGHVDELIERGVHTIFNPLIIGKPKENQKAQAGWMCPVIQGYSEVVRIHDRPEERHGVAYVADAFQWDHPRARDRQIRRMLANRFAIQGRPVVRALALADAAQLAFQKDLAQAGRDCLERLGPDDMAAVVAGRPYHADSYINHGVATHFVGMRIPVLEIDSLPGVSSVDLGGVRAETNNMFHTRLFGAGILAARHPNLELVQIVSFGCGHDAILSDELARVMRAEGGKQPLVLKLDEGENQGPLSIRVRSFVESVRTRRRAAVTRPRGGSL